MRKRIKRTRATLIYTHEDAKQQKEIGRDSLIVKLEQLSPDTDESIFETMQPTLNWSNPMQAYRGWRGYSIVDKP